jgi:hypothetical protein
MRLSPDERAERVQERVLQALIVSEGWLSKTQIHAAAFGGDEVEARERDEALRALETAGMVESRELARMVGRHGRRTHQFRYRTVGTVLSAEGCEHGSVDIDCDRFALLALALEIMSFLADTA